MNKRTPRTRLQVSNAPKDLTGKKLDPNNAARVAFGHNLGRIMTDSGYSQSELAHAIWGNETNSAGFVVAKNRHLISKYLNGKSFPSRETLEKIAKELDREVADFLPAQVMSAIDAGDAPMQFRELADQPGYFLVTLNRVLPSDIAHKILSLVGQAQVRANDVVSKSKTKPRKGKAS